MIRIGSGQLAGRIIEQPKTVKTRPLTAKVRASIFNRLGDISGLRVLDAYAGSGAFGLEALSLGVEHVSFIEHARSVTKVIASNLDALELTPKATIYTESVKTAAARLSGQTFDIILADPPYAELEEGDLVALINLLVDEGILIISHSARRVLPDLPNVAMIDSRTYGDTTISYYRGKIG